MEKNVFIFRKGITVIQTTNVVNYFQPHITSFQVVKSGLFSHGHVNTCYWTTPFLPWIGITDEAVSVQNTKYMFYFFE